MFKSSDSKSLFIKIFFGLNVLLFFLTFIFTAIHYPRSEHLDFDYLGFIIGALSLMVTLLIGWQIFVNLSMEKKFDKKIKEASKNLENKTNLKFKELRPVMDDTLEASIATSLYQLSCSEYTQHRNELALWFVLDAMVHCAKMKLRKGPIWSDTFHPIYELLKCCLNEFNDERKVTIFNQKQLDEYVEKASILHLYQVAQSLLQKSVAKDDDCNYYFRTYINTTTIDMVGDTSEPFISKKEIHD